MASSRRSRGVVAASHFQAAEAGAALLRAGGNAFDAAAAVQFALNVVEPHASGIGGGAFVMIRLADGTLTFLDSRERAPAASTANQFLAADGSVPDPFDSSRRGLTVGVPGTLLGQAECLRRWGTLKLSDALEPAIRLAEQGIVVSSFLAERLSQHEAKVRSDPAASAVFIRGGRALQADEILVQPDLARSFRLLAALGSECFYRGAMGSAVVEAVRQCGGRMRIEDLASYAVEDRAPLLGRLGNLELATAPPPGAGVTLLQLLALAAPLGLSRFAPLAVERIHLELQAMRLALLDRSSYLADPRFAQVPVGDLLDPDYLAARRRSVRSEALSSAPVPGNLVRQADIGASEASSPVRERGQTTHFVTADRVGNIVSCSSTIEDFFGSGIMVPGFGFLLNNQLTDFDSYPGGANEVRPFARPASSMVPTIVLRNREPLLALGSPGGPTIVTAVAQTLQRFLDDGQALADAIATPRFFAARYPRFTWEVGLSPGTLEALTRLGHQPAHGPRTIGSVQAVEFEPETGLRIGVADPRRLGGVVYVE